MLRSTTATLLAVPVLLLAAGGLPLAGTATASEIHTCQGGTATIVGTDGDDTLEGTPGPDVIVGLKGSDVIRGRGGDDVICTGASPMRFDDDDHAIYTDIAYGGDGGDVLVAGKGNAELRGGDGRDKLIARGDFAVLYGGRNDDELRAADPEHGTGMSGGKGDDVGYGGRNFDGWYDGEGPNGSDRFFGGDGVDFAQAGGHDGDRYEGGSGADHLYGGPGPDMLAGDSGDDELIGYGGDDLLKGGKGTDEADYTDELNGRRITERSVRINLTKGVATGFGHDRLRGVDDLATGFGADELVGDDGPNHFFLYTMDPPATDRASGDDRVDGRGGRDSVELDATEVRIDLGEGSAKVSEYPEYLGRLMNVENAIGSYLRDVLIGTAEANYLDSGGGDDDVIRGRGGDDVLVEGYGDQNLQGGDGHDTVDFSAWEELTVDDVGVTVDLAAGVARGDGTDVLTSIESVVGGQGDDQLLGNGRPTPCTGVPETTSSPDEAATTTSMVDRALTRWTVEPETTSAPRRTQTHVGAAERHDRPGTDAGDHRGRTLAVDGPLPLCCEQPASARRCRAQTATGPTRGAGRQHHSTGRVEGHHAAGP